ncbi:dockerin-like protein [Cellvibrio sp. NN19]|uniref:glucuronyl esterase domain-containing protein n=1 Tax=Cellvibrio chitinivorans TaxID=3102792 RepID=UPI002B4087DD|nr:dockerin-like protein [Cellvibrio sp. NN19]
MRVLIKCSIFSALVFVLGSCGGNGGNASTTDTSSAAISSTALSSSISEMIAGDYSAPVLSDFADLPPIATLPNPFVFGDGTAVTQKQQWPCRRAEIAAQVQHYELGLKPPAPAQVSGTISNEKIIVTVNENGKAISFEANIILPATGTAPYPAMIGIGNSYLNNEALSQQGIAVIQFPNNLLGEQQNGDSRGKGKFYEIYGSDHSASAMTAWAWGVSRLIDVLQTSNNSLINSDRLGVTGCSRNGKGALIAGALDERIALTIMQESGSGGAASWRISDAQLAAGQNVQTLRQIVTENVWFTERFKIFSEAATKLPFDHHSVMGLIAPRGLLVVENTTMEWLGNQSTYTTAVIAQEIWKALGASDNMGVSQVGGHNHCYLPASQQAYVDAFVQKFLLGDEAINTQVQNTDSTFPVEISRWVNWETPELN